MLAAFGSKLATVFVQPTMQAISVGLLSGVIAGGALVATGVVPGDGPPLTALLACPGSGAVMANVAAGQSVLAVARSEDGAWLKVHIGQPGIDGAWAPAAAVQLEGAMDGLPVADCAAPSSAEPTPQPLPSPSQAPTPSVAGTIVPTLEPTPGPTLPPGATASPTPKPTATPKITPLITPLITPSPTSLVTPAPTPFVSPSPTPLITPPPDLTPPSIFDVQIANAYTSGDGNYYIYPPAAAAYCPYQVATISAKVTDTGGSGLAGYTVTLRWLNPQTGAQSNQQMSYGLGTGRYSKAINAVDGWPGGTWIQYWITASDNAGNAASTSNPPDNAHWLFTGTCFA